MADYTCRATRRGVHDVGDTTMTALTFLAEFEVISSLAMKASGAKLVLQHPTGLYRCILKDREATDKHLRAEIIFQASDLKSAVDVGRSP
jgi:hypothetical protein